MALGNCTDCWMERRKAQLATLEVDEEPLCAPCARKRGISEEEIEAQVPKPAPPAYAVALDEEPGELPTKKETAVKVETESGRICEGFEKKCTVAIGEGSTTGLCTRCYAKKHYRINHPESKPGEGDKRTAKLSAREKPVVKVRVAIATPKIQAKEVMQGPRTGSIVVNEDQLNAFIMNTPFQQRLEMVNEWLARQA